MDNVHFDKDHVWGFRRYQFLSFMMLGIVNPLLTRFFQARGLDDAQIGWLLSTHWVVAAVLPLLWGMASDSSRDRRMPLLVAIVATSAAFSGFYLCHSFWSFLAAIVVFAALFRAIIPMGISLTFTWAESQGRDYSRIRLFGTAGYVVSLVLITFPLREHGLEVVFPIFLVFAAAAVGGLLLLPKIPGSGRRKLDWSALKLLARPDFSLTLACTFLAQAAIACHYVFFAPYLYRKLSVDNAYIGLFYAFGSVLELLMLTQTGRLIKRFGTKWVLAAGMLGIAVRLAVYAAFPIVTVVFLIQGLHAFTFAAVHASTVTFVNYSAPPKWRSSAQTIFEGLTIGLGSAVGALVGGQIAHAWSYPVLFGCASAAAACACIVYAIFGRSVALVREHKEKPSEGLAEA